MVPNGVEDVSGKHSCDKCQRSSIHSRIKPNIWAMGGQSDPHPWHARVRKQRFSRAFGGSHGVPAGRSENACKRVWILLTSIQFPQNSRMCFQLLALACSGTHVVCFLRRGFTYTEHHQSPILHHIASNYAQNQGICIAAPERCSIFSRVSEVQNPGLCPSKRLTAERKSSEVTSAERPLVKFNGAERAPGT